MVFGFDEVLLAKVRRMGPQGFRLVRNATLLDPVKDFVEGMPEDWVKLYVANCYALCDPVLLWTVTNSGAKRWADIPIRDVKDVLKKAKAFGLEHGVIVAEQKDGRSSALSVARKGEPYTDEEIAQCEELFREAMYIEKPRNECAREDLHILEQLARGTSLEAIAAQDEIAISTVKYRLKRVRESLDAKSTTQAVAEAVRRGLLRNPIA